MSEVKQSVFDFNKQALKEQWSGFLNGQIVSTLSIWL